jgi:PilZ domain
MPVSMALPSSKPRNVPRAQERRRHQRVKVNLLGRYMLSDRREFPCQVIDMSPGGMAVVVPVIGEPGERVIAYVDHLGRLEGTIARLLDNGFAMTISATSRKRDKLAAQLTWLANRQILNLPEDRRHGRFTPKNPLARLILPNGTNVTCRVIDLSASGAAVAIAPNIRPPVGAALTIGKTPGRVVRHIEDGFAIEFTRLQHPDSIEDNVTGE